MNVAPRFEFYIPRERGIVKFVKRQKYGNQNGRRKFYSLVPFVDLIYS